MSECHMFNAEYVRLSNVQRFKKFTKLNGTVCVISPGTNYDKLSQSFSF